MPITLNGTTGVVTPGATIGSINGILKSSSGVVSQAVAGTDYLTPTSGGSITLDTAQTASGTSVDFTGIPSWAKRITVMLNGVSTNGTADVRVQLGSGSIDPSGYIGSYTSQGTGNVVSGVILSSGFVVGGGGAVVFYGGIIITNFSGNTWVAFGNTGRTDLGATFTVGGSKTLSGTLDSLRVTSANTFDAGTINISYE
jgi:hypothetical protein